MRKSEQAGADVAAVGGGVAGLSAPRELARRRVSVAVVESVGPGAGGSGAAAGMLPPQAQADARREYFALLGARRGGGSRGGVGARGSSERGRGRARGGRGHCARAPPGL